MAAEEGKGAVVLRQPTILQMTPDTVASLCERHGVGLCGLAAKFGVPIGHLRVVESQQRADQP